METIEQTFSDNEGNHLLVALCFYDDDYKTSTLFIPEEFLDIEVADIEISKAFTDKPINPVVFFRMSAWLLEQFLMRDNAIFTFICSTDELETNHPNILPQQYRWNLFDALFKRYCDRASINHQDIVIGPEGHESYARAFYRDSHAPIIHVMTGYLKEKQG